MARNYAYYDCWQKASIALLILDIRSKEEYENRYEEDSCLPIDPEKFYPGFPGWDQFLAQEELAVPKELSDRAEPEKEKIQRPERYATWQQASEAVKVLGIKSRTQYNRRYREDPMLPSSLNNSYPDFPGAEIFFGVKNEGKRKKNFYPTWQQASQAVQKLGVKSSSHYLRSYKQDDRLPSAPRTYYKDFPGWDKFLGRDEVKKEQIQPPERYATWQQASEAVKKLGITSWHQYHRRYREDPKLGSNPNILYEDFPGAEIFFGVKRKPRKKKNYYSSWQEAGKAAQMLGIKSSLQYVRKYKQDIRLPSNPNVKYKDFPGWDVFLGKAEIEEQTVETEYYATWQLASKAAVNLGIKSLVSYCSGAYMEDDKLHPDPQTFYEDFPGWKKFLGIKGKKKKGNEKKYSTWQEASMAAKKLGIKTSTQYCIEKRYKQDLRLPSSPQTYYSDFPGWGVFLGTHEVKGAAVARRKKKKYPTWQQASKAARRLGISSSTEYMRGKAYKKDSLLPSNPQQYYHDFPGWGEFLGTNNKRGAPRKNFYPTWQQARNAALKLGITASTGYINAEQYKFDRRLPSNPQLYYEDFPGWKKFLTPEVKSVEITDQMAASIEKGLDKKDGFASQKSSDVKRPKNGYYEDWETASRAAIKLGITTQEQYENNCHKDSRLPKKPKLCYSEFKDWDEFEKMAQNEYYSTWQEASEAVQNMGIKSWSEYSVRQNEDEMLPLHPDKEYEDFPGWRIYLGKENDTQNGLSYKKDKRKSGKNLYPTWKEASKIVREMGIKTSKQYRDRYKEDPRLPSTPERYYKDFPDWDKFFVREKNKKYTTWQEASEAARKLNIKRREDYFKEYERDPRLHKYPADIYKDFPGWRVFLNNRRPRYATWQEASQATIRLEISSRDEYLKRYTEDEKLRCAPYQVYEDFPGWRVYLGKAEKESKEDKEQERTGDDNVSKRRKREDMYQTWQEAAVAAQKVGIKSEKEYRKRYKSDQKLPSSPETIYLDFPGYGIFLSNVSKRRKRENMYPTWQEAAVAAQRLGIKNRRDYGKKYKLNQRLPCDPSSVYMNFPGYEIFLGNVGKRRTRKNLYQTWQEASAATQRLGIKTQIEYRKRYKSDQKLPSSPDTLYFDFPGWRVYLGKVDKELNETEKTDRTGGDDVSKRRKRQDLYQTWQEAAVAAHRLGIKSRSEYRKKYRSNQKLPGAPDNFYKDFPGWKVFLDETSLNYYPTWQEASESAQKLKIQTSTEYEQRYNLNSRLPADPSVYYKDFPGWIIFLNVEKKDYYLTWQEASAAAQKMMIFSESQYKMVYKADPRLPSTPDKFYDDFPSWLIFLGKVDADSLVLMPHEKMVKPNYDQMVEMLEGTNKFLPVNELFRYSGIILASKSDTAVDDMMLDLLRVKITTAIYKVFEINMCSVEVKKYDDKYRIDIVFGKLQVGATSVSTEVQIPLGFPHNAVLYLEAIDPVLKQELPDFEFNEIVVFIGES